MKPQLKHFRDYLTYFTKQQAIPGLSVTVVADNAIVLAEGFGYADVERQIPALPDTPYIVGSIMKPISAILMLNLVESGLFDLDKPMREYYKDYDAFCERLRQYVVRGVQPTYVFANYNGQQYEITPRHHLTHSAQGVPGRRFSYNSFLYGVTARAVETASNTTFFSSFKDRIVHQLGLTNTTPHSSGIPLLQLRNELAKAYRYSQEGQWLPSDYPEVAFNAGAGLVTSAVDLAHIDIALSQGRLLSQESRQQMWSPYRLSSGQDAPYGLGWYLEREGGLEIIWHTGWWLDATSAIYARFPQHGISLILMANSDRLLTHNPLEFSKISDSIFIRAFIETVLQ